jgi:hydroxyacylglutathione hydrolase
MLEIFPIPAFADNYIWLLRSGRHAVVVDPGDAAPVMARLKDLSLTLDAILITHHHADHIGGVNELLQHWPVTVYAPKHEQFNFHHEAVEENSLVHLPSISLGLSVIEVPGHTLGHVAYYGANSLFCGDTLFGGGCGRLFEGTSEQMYHSLQRLAELPGNTAVYCTHEYTEQNLRFASMLEPDNPALKKRRAKTRQLRLAAQPTLPSSIGLELETNPFLRCDQPAIQLAASLNTAVNPLTNPVSVFASIREMRNHY